jgi:hypothetical protein
MQRVVAFELGACARSLNNPSSTGQYHVDMLNVAEDAVVQKIAAQHPVHPMLLHFLLESMWQENRTLLDKLCNTNGSVDAVKVGTTSWESDFKPLDANAIYLARRLATLATGNTVLDLDTRLHLLRATGVIVAHQGNDNEVDVYPGSMKLLFLYQEVVSNNHTH